MADPGGKDDRAHPRARESKRDRDDRRAREVKAEKAAAAEARAREILEYGRGEFDQFAQRYQVGDKVADELLSLDAAGGLAAIVEQVYRLHDAALARPELSRSDDDTNFRVVSDTRTALECVRFAAHLLGYGRTLTDATRDGAGRRARQQKGKI